MPLPPRDFTRIGPKEGERLPEIRLPDQTGAVVDLHEARGARKALVVFYRSADWWPFCRSQLVQLQKVWPTLDAEGVALFAISYDSVEILRGFAEKHGITFPLLSDEGSHVIRQLGLLNERVQEDHAHYGIASNARHVGLPYPGVFVLDERGVITQKRFHESYRVRDTGIGLVAQMLGRLEAVDASDVRYEDEAVRVRAWLDSPTYAFFQRLHLNVEVSVAPGFHVYGGPVPAGFVPLSVEVAPIDGVEIGTVAWPAPHPFTVDGLDEEFWVHEGTVRSSLPLTFAGPPGAGDHVIQVTVSYQACSDSACLVPTSISLSLPVKEVALVGRELPGSERSGTS